VTLGPGITVYPTQLKPGGSARIVYAAPATLAGQGNLSIHYGVNYWTPDASGTAATNAAMTKRGDGSFEVTVPLPTDARLLDFVFFFSGSGSTQEWDNNGTLDYHRGVGVPRIGPYLSFRDNLGQQPDRDPAHALTVSFRSDHPCLARVRYGTSANTLAQQVDEPWPSLEHHLNLAALAADTVYYYQVECRGAGPCAPTERAEVVHFRTAPTSPASFSFLHLSDPQDYRSADDHWRDVAGLLAQPPFDDIRFVVITGDLVGSDDPARWWDFFDRGRALLARKPILPAVGNHDATSASGTVSTSSFEGLFDMESSSGNPTYYGLRYGSASILVLNSQTASSGDWKPGGVQFGWVSNVLPQLPTTWRFAAWHIPPYNAGVRHSDQLDAVRPMTALFQDQLDWVLCGHEHVYQRSRPIRYLGEVNGKESATTVATYGGPGGGVGYLVAPVAGHDPPGDTFVPNTDPSRALLAYPTASLIVGDKVAPWAGFTRITVTGKTIQIQTFALGQSVPKDTLSYGKP
jgi:hypothetical protein